MKTKDLRNASLIAVAAGVVLVPVVRYLLARRKMTLAEVGSETATTAKKLFGAYRNKHLPHHRKAHLDGHHLN